MTEFVGSRLYENAPETRRCNAMISLTFSPCLIGPVPGSSRNSQPFDRFSFEDSRSYVSSDGKTFELTRQTKL